MVPFEFAVAPRGLATLEPYTHLQVLPHSILRALLGRSITTSSLQTEKLRNLQTAQS